MSLVDSPAELEAGDVVSFRDDEDMISA